MQGQLLLLLGQELRYSKGSDKWSDFGGGTKARESDGELETPEETAAREFHEETCGICQSDFHEYIPRASTEELTAGLKDGRYLFKTQFDVPGRSRRYYTMFTKIIPYQESLPTTFASTQDVLWKLQSCSQIRHPAVRQPPIVNQDYLEKQAIRYFTLAELHLALQNHNTVHGETKRYVLRPHFAERLAVVLDRLLQLEHEMNHGCAGSPTLQETPVGKPSWREKAPMRISSKRIFPPASRPRKRRFYNFRNFKPRTSDWR